MKQDYHIRIVTKVECKDLLEEFHYLSKISKGFKSGFNVGLFHKTLGLVGVCIFTGFPVPELVKGCFGLDRDDQKGFYELSRLVLNPYVQKEEHNLASWFVSRGIRLLRKSSPVRAILSYADTSFHQGIVYKACNFNYYGTSAKKKDFWVKQQDGTFIKHSRGKTKGVLGEWRDRSLKHRFLLVFDKKLNCLWKREPFLENKGAIK